MLNRKHREAYQAVRPDDAKVKTDKKLNPRDDAEARAVQKFMCDNFFDVRTFGAVMSTGVNCGQVKGPVQLSFAQSAEAVVPLEISITRMAATSEEEKAKRDKEEGEGDERRENRTMGRKYIIPYGLYRAHGFVSAAYAARTGFSNDDLAFLWDALRNMFEHDRSAARGEMTARRLIAFRHESPLGNAPAHALFDQVKVDRNSGGDVIPIGDPRLDNAPPARSFADYHVAFDRENLPPNVDVLDLL